MRDHHDHVGQRIGARRAIPDLIPPIKEVVLRSPKAERRPVKRTAPEPDAHFAARRGAVQWRA
jgi:hypothetical protein